jgi:protein SCO1/2
VRRALPALVLAIALAAPGTIGCSKADDGAAGRVLPGGSAGPGTPADAPVLPPGGDFTLTGPGGTPFALADLRGHPVVLFFGYASCPDFCPRAMSTVKAARAQLDPAQAERLRTVFVSVDPERDTPASLEAYLRNLGVPAIGVTGTHEQLRAAIRGYGGGYERDTSTSSTAYAVMHPMSLYVVDAAGRLRAKVDNGDADALVAALRSAS